MSLRQAQGPRFDYPKPPHLLAESTASRGERVHQLTGKVIDFRLQSVSLEVEVPDTNKGLSSMALKIAAISAMLIDHTPYLFDGGALEDFPWFLFHCIGRIAGPIFFFCIVEGYRYTRDKHKYTMRLFLFGCVSYVPYIYYFHGGLPNAQNFWYLNVFFSLWAGLLTLRARHEIKRPLLRYAAMTGCFVFSATTDYGFQGVIVVLIFDYFYDNKKAICAAYLVTVGILLDTELYLGYKSAADMVKDFSTVSFYGGCVYILGYILPLLFIWRYNGKPGGGGGVGKVMKWLFYLFYPLHICVLILVKNCM
jgi:hypothetical protein